MFYCSIWIVQRFRKFRKMAFKISCSFFWGRNWEWNLAFLWHIPLLCQYTQHPSPPSTQHQWVQNKEQRILTESSQSLSYSFSAHELHFLSDPLKVSCLTLLFFCENQSSFLPWALGFASLMPQEGEVEWVRACPQRWEQRNGLNYSILGVVSSYCTVETTQQCAVWTACPSEPFSKVGGRYISYIWMRM